MRSTRNIPESTSTPPPLPPQASGSRLDESFDPPIVSVYPSTTTFPDSSHQIVEPIDLVEGVEFKNPKASWFWMKNSAGEASASLTFATMAFVVITIWILISIFETIMIGGNSFATREPPGEGMIIAYLGTSFSLYFGRRYTDRGRSAIIKE